MTDAGTGLNGLEEAEHFLQQLGSSSTQHPVDSLVAQIDHHRSVLESLREHLSTEALRARAVSTSSHLLTVKTAALASGAATFGTVEVVRSAHSGSGSAGAAPAGGATPQTASGTAPQSAGGATPQTAGGTAPQSAAGTTPQSAAGTTPQSAGTTAAPTPTSPTPTAPTPTGPSPTAATSGTPPPATPTPAAPTPAGPTGAGPGPATPTPAAPAGVPRPTPAGSPGPAPQGGATPPGPAGPQPTSGGVGSPPPPPAPPRPPRPTGGGGVPRPVIIGIAGLVGLTGIGVGLAVGLGGGGGSSGTPTAAVAAQISCQGNEQKIFDNSNTAGVFNGGTAPSFSTQGQAYCVTRIQTYHWNNALGRHPGSVGLRQLSGPTSSKPNVGPYPAQSSSGQNNAPNVNWFASPGTSQPVVINGTYTCVDSDPTTWSQNQQSGGNGFCIVYGIPAVTGAGAAGGTPKSTTTAVALATTTTAPPPQTLKMGAIQATFVQVQFATFYTVNPNELAGLPIQYSWKLSLQQVDPPGDGGVDAGCDNGGVLNSNAAQFVWHHPDAADSTPPGLYHCDHSLQGTSGHEGLITVTVTDGKWTCTASYPGTNTGVGGPATCAPVPPPPPPNKVNCQGAQVKIFDNSNGGGVQNGGRPPTFSTGGKAYCLTRIQTYHWNNGQGRRPGQLGLVPVGSAQGARVGPAAAQSSSGQNNAPNVNWFINFPTNPPLLIQGSYQCVDSDSSTWSTDGQAQGFGFCTVYGILAVISP